MILSLFVASVFSRSNPPPDRVSNERPRDLQPVMPRPNQPQDTKSAKLKAQQSFYREFTSINAKSASPLAFIRELAVEVLFWPWLRSAALRSPLPLRFGLHCTNPSLRPSQTLSKGLPNGRKQGRFGNSRSPFGGARL